MQCRAPLAASRSRIRTAWFLAASLLGIGLSACAPVPRQIEALQRAESACCETLADLPYVDALVAQYVSVALTAESSPTAPLPTGRTYVAAYRLPSPAAARMVLRTFISRNAGLQETIVCPWVTFLDESHLPVGEAVTSTRPLSVGGKAFDRMHYALTLPIPPEARYALVHANLQAAGQTLPTNGLSRSGGGPIVLGSMVYMTPTNSRPATTPPCGVVGEVAMIVR
jgi:hypothetical protein